MTRTSDTQPSDFIRTAQEFINAWTKGEGRKKPRVHLPDAENWGGVHLILAARTTYDFGHPEACFELSLFYNQSPFRRLGYQYIDIPVLIKFIQNGLPFPLSHPCWTGNEQQQMLWLGAYHYKLQGASSDVFKELLAALAPYEIFKTYKEYGEYFDIKEFENKEIEEVWKILL